MLSKEYIFYRQPVWIVYKDIYRHIDLKMQHLADNILRRNLHKPNAKVFFIEEI